MFRSKNFSSKAANVAQQCLAVLFVTVMLFGGAYFLATSPEAGAGVDLRPLKILLGLE